MKLEHIAVIGAGTMGRGIAQWFLQQNISVSLVDTNSDVLSASVTAIEQSFQKLMDKGKLTSDQVRAFLSSLRTGPIDLLKDEQLVIEAIVEKKEIKISLFQKLDQQLSQQTIFASNTSSLSIAELAQAVSKQRQKQFIGLHFFNPATIMKLVEIIDINQTNPEITTSLYQWFEAKGKVPAQCQDGPGFIVNRLARSFYGEALRIVGEENTEKEKEVDQILKDVGGFNMGPFELMDLIGIDINLDVTNIVWKAFGENPRFAPHSLQEKMVKEGRLGRKSKRGFYDY